MSIFRKNYSHIIRSFIISVVCIASFSCAGNLSDLNMERTNPSERTTQPRDVRDCTKKTTTSRNLFTGRETTTTTITPCEREDCPAKKHGI